MSQSRHHEPTDILISTHQPELSSFKHYIVGFLCSVALTLAAYVLARYGVLNKPLMIVALSLLALMQFIVQLVFFLHIGKEFSPRLKLIVMLFMIMIVIILVGGSIWIMDNIDGRMMNPKLEVQYMNNQNNL